MIRGNKVCAKYAQPLEFWMSESVREREIINGEKECGIHTGGRVSDRISLAGGARVNQFSGDTPESLIQFIPVGLEGKSGFSFFLSYKSFVMNSLQSRFSKI